MNWNGLYSQMLPKKLTQAGRKFWIVAIAIFVMAAVASTLLNFYGTIHPAEPVRGVEAPLPPVPISSITIPIRVNIAALSDQINAHYSATPGPSGIYWTSGQIKVRGGIVQAGIHRNGNASVSTDNGCLNISMPLKVNNGRIEWEKRVLGVPTRYHWDFSGSGVLHSRACFSVGPDWKLQPSISTDFSWVERPLVDIHVLGLPKKDISKWVEPKLLEKLSAIEETLSRKVSEIPLRAKLESTWAGMYLPQQRTQHLPLTLEIEPISISVEPVVSEGAELVIRPTVMAKIRVHAGTNIKPRHAKPLPENSGVIGDDQFMLSVRVDAPFKELNDLARDKLAGNTYELGNERTIKINAVSISSLGDEVLMKVDFGAKLTSVPITDVSGWLYFTGRPRYNDKERLLVIEDIDFDLNTRNLLANSADVLLHEQFRQMLREKMTFDLSQKIDPIRKRVEAGVRGVKLSDGVAFNADVRSLNVSDIHIGSDRIGIFFTAKGTSNITVIPSIE